MVQVDAGECGKVSRKYLEVSCVHINLVINMLCDIWFTQLSTRVLRP